MAENIDRKAIPLDDSDEEFIVDDVESSEGTFESVDLVDSSPERAPEMEEEPKK